MMLFNDSIIKGEHRCCPPTTPNLGCPVLQEKIDRPYNNGKDDIENR